MSIPVTLIPGDGIGPEVVDAAVRAIEATGAEIDWEPRDAGAGAIPKHGAPLPEGRWSRSGARGSVSRARWPRRSAAGTPASTWRCAGSSISTPTSGRPAPSPGWRGATTDVDLVVVRENTEGEYSGIEHYIDPARNAAEAISIITRHGCDRIIRFAFEYARANQRKQITLVHKANILKMTSGLFLQIGREIAATYPDIAFNDLIVDNTAMQLVRDPTRFDVIVTTNLFGDILSRPHRRAGRRARPRAGREHRRGGRHLRGGARHRPRHRGQGDGQPHRGDAGGRDDARSPRAA